MERLDKYLANAGIGTRSEVKKYIKSGRVSLNGTTVKNGEIKVDPELDEVLFDRACVRKEGFGYYLLHKPAGYVTATRDDHDSTVMDLLTIPGKDQFFPVGRLDKDTEGLLLITNDGDLAHRLLSPKKHVPKTYFARITGRISEDAKDAFKSGLDIGDEKPALPAELEIVMTPENAPEKTEAFSEVRVTVCEGRVHQVKRMFQAVGHEVV